MVMNYLLEQMGFIMRDDIKRYYESKTRCPRCGSKNIVETEVHVLDLPEGQYRDRRNQTMCRECQWRGVIDDLRR